MPDKIQTKSEANIHASCVAFGRRGILLLGPSGSGKSDLALRLVDEGAQLVADDRTILFIKNGALHAKAPASIKGLLEMRGVGIVALPVCDSVKIVLAVQLAIQPGSEGARLPHPGLYHAPVCLKPTVLPPKIALNARFASTPAKIRAALRAFAGRTFRDTFHVK